MCPAAYSNQEWRVAAIVDIDIAGGTSAAQDMLASTVCAIGVFDGVHRGHRFLIDTATACAREKGARMVVVTFDVDPDEVLSEKDVKKLMSNNQRIAALAALDVDAVAVLHFNGELAALSPEDFLDALFAGGAPAAIFVGEDFRFGEGTKGDLASLRDWAARYGAAAPEISAIGLKMQDGSPITSTRIRALLGQAKLQEALGLLGHSYTIGGPVVHGRGQGTGFGVSTADLCVPEDLMAAADGVYAAFATLGREDADARPTDKRYMAAVSVGIPPTFEDSAKANVEAHLLDFSGDIYGEALTLDMRAYLRPMQKFETIDDLMRTIHADIDTTRILLS